MDVNFFTFHKFRSKPRSMLPIRKSNTDYDVQPEKLCIDILKKNINLPKNRKSFKYKCYYSS
jgi:hypothetical protein